MGLRSIQKKPKNEKKITAKDIRTANRVLKKGHKFPKQQKGSAGYLTRKEFKSPYKGQKNTKEEKRDLDLVYDYGTKAQKAKSFGRVKKKTAPIPNVRRGGQMVKISRKDGGQVFDGNKFVMSFYELMK